MACGQIAARIIEAIIVVFAYLMTAPIGAIGLGCKSIAICCSKPITSTPIPTPIDDHNGVPPKKVVQADSSPQKNVEPEIIPIPTNIPQHPSDQIPDNIPLNTHQTPIPDSLAPPTAPAIVKKKSPYPSIIINNGQPFSDKLSNILKKLESDKLIDYMGDARKIVSMLAHADHLQHETHVSLKRVYELDNQILLTYHLFKDKSTKPYDTCHFLIDFNKEMIIYRHRLHEFENDSMAIYEYPSSSLLLCLMHYKKLFSTLSDIGIKLRHGKGDDCQSEIRNGITNHILPLEINTDSITQNCNWINDSRKDIFKDKLVERLKFWQKVNFIADQVHLLQKTGEVVNTFCNYKCGSFKKNRPTVIKWNITKNKEKIGQFRVFITQSYCSYLFVNNKNKQVLPIHQLSEFIIKDIIKPLINHSVVYYNGCDFRGGTRAPFLTLDPDTGKPSP